LPKRIEALEQRIAVLENKGGTGACKGCRQADPLLISQEKEPGPFGELGAMIEKYRCPNCGQETIRHTDS